MVERTLSGQEIVMKIPISIHGLALSSRNQISLYQVEALEKLGF
jgi:hypothetical protein